MRHYLWYTADGTIGGQEVHHGGFPAECDLTNATTQHRFAQTLIANRKKMNPECIGFIAFDCQCVGDSENGGFCACAYNKQANFFVADGQLVQRPLLTLVLDGAEVQSNTIDAPMLKTPGSDVQLQLKADVPDGFVFSIPRQATVGPEMVPSWPISFTFQGGLSNGVTLCAPLKGTVSGIGFYHEKWLPPRRLYIKGW